MGFDPRRMIGIVLARKPWRLRSAAVRRRAEEMRRARDFAGACALYRDYIEMRPDHATAWMQYGHCLKESGQLAAADAAYAQAVRRGPRNRDAVVARAHFLKISGRRREAWHAFGAAIALGAGEEARREWLSLQAPGANPAADASPAGARVWIDIADLLIFLNHNRHVSGIQRVQMVLLGHALAQPREACCVTSLPWDPRIWCFSPVALRDFYALFQAEGGGSPAMRAAIAQLLDSAAEVLPEPGCTLFQPGAFWLGGGNPPLHRTVRAAGMRVVPLFYDLIPVRNPEVCVPDLVRDFSWALGVELRSVDAIIAISTHTACDVAAFMAEKAIDPCPIIAVPLAHRLNEDAPAPVWTPQIAALRDSPFVLSVGTLEPRKNHVLLLRVWQALVEEGLDPPRLVLVGKRGWLTHGFDAEMALSRAVGKRVIVLTDLSDAEIETLYGACLFTTFPSLAEGWGLPVGESLARGKICVASNRDSMPEVGGDATPYIDPLDVPAAVAVFRRLLFEPGALVEAEDRLRQRFEPRGWPEVVSAILAALDKLPGGPPVLPAGPLLPFDMAFRPSPHFQDDTADPFGPPLRMMLAEGWMQPGPEGAAMATARAPLHLTAAGDGTLRLRLYAGQALRLEAAGQAIMLAAESAGWLEVPVRAGPIRIDLAVTDGDPAKTPLLPPGLWLTGVELRRVGG